MADFNSISNAQVFAKQLALLEEHAQLLKAFAEPLVNAGLLHSNHTEVLSQLYVQALAAVEGAKTCQHIISTASSTPQPRSNTAPVTAPMIVERQKRKQALNPEDTEVGSPSKRSRVEAFAPTTRLRLAKPFTWRNCLPVSMADHATRHTRQQQDGGAISNNTADPTPITDQTEKPAAFASDDEYENIEAEVAARLSRNEQRRKEMSGEILPVAVKRKRRSGELIVAIKNDRRSSGESATQTKRRKRSY